MPVPTKYKSTATGQYTIDYPEHTIKMKIQSEPIIWGNETMYFRASLTGFDFTGQVNITVE